MALLTKQNEEKLALAASMINSFNAFLARELIPSTEMTPEMNQVVEEDLDELDVAWNMAMSAFKADKFAKRYGRRPMSASPGFLKNRLRCYRCYEPEHFARDCKKVLTGYKATQAAAARNKERSMVPVTPAETATSSGQGNSGAGRALIAQEQNGFNWADAVAQVESMKLSESAAVDKVHQCLMAMTEEPKSLAETVNSLLCTEHCRKKVALLRSQNSALITDNNTVMGKYISLRENNKILYEKIEALKKDIAQLHRDVNRQQCWVHDYKHRLIVKTLECDSVKGELELLTGKYKQNELNIKKFDTSSATVQNLCNVQLAYQENKGKGLGYKKVPPPYNHNYSRLPVTEQEMENYDTMMYGKPSDYVDYDPSKSKRSPYADFKKPMSFVKDENVQNESADNESDQKNETVINAETETETKTEPVNKLAEEMKESSSNSDSVENTNFSSLCAESVRNEEESKEDDESHRSAANNVVSDKNGIYAWNSVFSWFAETWGVPTKTDKFGSIILDYACDKNDCVENVVNVENDVAGEPDASSEEFETSVSNNSENHSDNSEYHTCMSETLNDTSDTPYSNDDFDVTNSDNEEFTVEQGSSDDLGNQTEDSGIPDNELKSLNVSDCDDQSDFCSITKEESQVVLDTDFSSSELPESSNVENSEGDLTEEETSIESNSAETHGNMEAMEKEFIEINSTVESNDETIEEIDMETFSQDSPEDMLSTEKEDVKVTLTDNSPIDPNSNLNRTESTESVPPKRKRSRRNRRPKRKNPKRETSNLKQTEPKLKGEVEDTYSCADSCKAGSSKNKHTPKHSVSNELKRHDQFSRITQAELDVFFSKRHTCFNCGIPGHITRNCVHRPYYSRNMYHQKACTLVLSNINIPRQGLLTETGILLSRKNKSF
ncbi:papilin-like [Helianthus annuus]|uniref:papilin-like n=1 Tax=Helianthus annuus TaxID=4232 RepID=UPI000B8F49D1|nr:papilin-like [Helianthus annuus]